MIAKTAVVRRLLAAVFVAGFIFSGAAPGPAVASDRPTPSLSIKNPPIAACDTLVRIDPSQLPSRYSWPVYWSLAVNFKAFVTGDIRRPYACLRLFGMDKQSGSYVDLSKSGNGVPITGCEVQGNVPMSTRSLPGLSTTLGVASFTGGTRQRGFVACELDLRNTVAQLYSLGEIKAMPDGSTPSLELFQTYDSFAYAVVASMRGQQPAGFAQYLPGTHCRRSAELLGFPVRCGPTSYAAGVVAPGMFEQHTVTDGIDGTTPQIVINTHNMVADQCLIRPAAVQKPLIWSSYRGYITGYSDYLHHLMLDITNSYIQLMCDLPGGQRETPFYTGQSVLYLGGTPGATSAWGELYEVTADPGGSSTGTDGVK